MQHLTGLGVLPAAAEEPRRAAVLLLLSLRGTSPVVGGWGMLAAAFGRLPAASRRADAAGGAFLRLPAPGCYALRCDEPSHPEK